MTLILNESDWDELYEYAPVTCPDGLVLDDFEELTGVPEILGRGYDRGINLLPGVWLSFSDFKVSQDFVAKFPSTTIRFRLTFFCLGCFILMRFILI